MIAGASGNAVPLTVTPLAQPPVTAAPVALTMGDPAGIGLEIALKAWLQRAHHELTPFCFYGNAGSLRARAAAFKLDVPVTVVDDPRDASAVFARALPVRDIALAAPAVAGEPSSGHAAAIISAISNAVADARAGLVRAVVTNPISKTVLYEAGFKYPGHTEYLAHLAANEWPGGSYHPVMMLAGGGLKVVPLTIHVPLKDVPALLTRDLIIATVRILTDALHRDFGISRPRIAVAGLNPHAGEAGAIGIEDRDIIAPAIAALAAEGFDITGPLPADTLFHASARQTYDAALCMYHDQALIPVKTLAFNSGVNVTLGLPFVRTSPDHGTAFDIAKQGVASPLSLVEALRLASTMSQRRALLPV